MNQLCDELSELPGRQVQCVRVDDRLTGCSLVVLTSLLSSKLSLSAEYI